MQFTDFATLVENEINAISCGIWITSSDSRVAISKNKLNIDNSYGIRLSSCFAPPGIASYLVNNFIHVGGSGSAQGIHINNCFSTYIYHNSVHITSTNQSNGHALYISSGNSGIIRLLNNIFATFSSVFCQKRQKNQPR